MALSDFTPNRTEVVLKEAPRLTVHVRGLNTEDLSDLIHEHMNDLVKLYGVLKDEGGMGTLMQRLNMDGFILNLVALCPVLAANIIVFATDEPNALAQARMLPMPVQARVLYEVVRLTFEDVGGPKAFVALVQEKIGKLLPNTGRKATETL